MKSKKKYIVAIDIGGTKTNIGFFYKTKLENIINFPTNKFGPNNIEIIKEIILKSKKEISAIGLSLTGLINNGLWNPVNKRILGNFKNYPIVKNMNTYFNVPVYALGDTQAAALGELYFGGGKKLLNFFYITISTGIGGSLIQNRNLFDNKISDVGSIGHNVIKFNGMRCGCGKRGCLEAYASGNALIKKNRIKNCANTKDLLTKFKNNVQTKKIVDKAVEMIVESINNVNIILRINNFIIGGSVGLNSYFYKKIIDQLKQVQSPIKIQKAKLQSKAELYGCFVFITKKLFLKK